VKTTAKMYRGQYRAIEDAVETWKADHEEAMVVCDLEVVIRTGIWLNDRCRELVQGVFKAAFAGTIHAPEDLGKCILKLLKAGCEMWETVANGAQEAEDRGYRVEGVSKIADALAASKALAADFDSRWPFIRREEVEKGSKEIATGKFATGEELLRELQGQSS
jgi:hypothetical protein